MAKTYNSTILNTLLAYRDGDMVLRSGEQQGRFGLELEMEGSNLPTALPSGARQWGVVSEGSLRGGVEYVFNRPLDYEPSKEAVRKLFKALEDNGANLWLSSYRASTHVHINVQSWRWTELLHFGVVFATIEPLLLRFCGPTRDGNHFCLPTYDSGQFASYLGWIANLLTRPKRNVPMEILESRPGKYSSFALNSLCRFGSVEIRCFPMATSVASVDRWLGMLEELVKINQEFSLKSPNGDDFLAYVFRNPEELAERVFGRHGFPLEEVQPSPPTSYINFGAENAYEVSANITEGFKP